MNEKSAVTRLLSTHRPGPEALRVLSASGQLGYGIPESSFRAGMARQPHFVACDMGSIDPGPYYLGAGVMAAPQSMVYRDLEMVLCAALEAGIPLVIGSAGTAGARPHLDATVAVLEQIAKARGLHFRLATVRSDVSPELVIQALREGQLEPIGDMAMPTEAAVANCSHIVGQCGTETLKRALALAPDVVLAGRACDTAVFAALPEMLGYPVALSLHMAKIIECTSLCCQPGGRDSILAELTMTDFTLESMNPLLHATPASVAAHALYEQADPSRVDEPTGTLYLDAAQYAALDAHRTRVSGARFEVRAHATLKIEAAARVGARVVLLAGVADPVLLQCLPQALDTVQERVHQMVPGAWCVYPHLYGQGAVRPLKPQQFSAHEVGLVLEFIAPEAEMARTAAAVFKQNLLHFGFPGRLSTAGNLAFAFTPSELDAHEAYQFVLYHVMQAAPLDSIFEVQAGSIGAPPKV